MTTSLPAVEGGCLCGRVRYRAVPDHREGYYCHCRMCQLAFGSPRAAYLNLRKDEVTWLSGPAWYASSKIARRAFCAHCGTPLAFQFLDSQNMDLSIGSLDDPSAFKPVVHWSSESIVASWHVDDGLPQRRLDANEAIAKRWRDAYGDGVVPGVAATKSSE